MDSVVSEFHILSPLVITVVLLTGNHMAMEHGAWALAIFFF